MKTIGSILLFFLAISLFGQPLNKSRLDSFFDLLEKHDQALGSVAIAEDGRIMYQRSFGFAYADDNDTLTNSSSTFYRIGSITKTFTATIIGHLAEEGLLSLDDTLWKFYAGIDQADEITIRHMLNHSSGIHNFTNDSDYLNYLAEAKTKQELLDIIQSAEHEFLPGEKHEYSNSNYVLLGLIAEDVTGKTYQALLDSLITKPLQLENTRVGSVIIPQQNMAYSYISKGNWAPSTETDMSIPRGAGAIISTPADLLEFMHALRNGKIISQEMADSLLPPAHSNFGMGLFEFPFYNRTAYGHNGGIDGFRATLTHFDQEEVAIAITLNGEKFDINEIGVAMLSIYFNEDYEFPSFHEVKLSEKALEKFVGRYKNPNFPLDIVVYTEDETLFAQATGQQAFPLKAVSEQEFTFSPAGINMKFEAEKSIMHFKQGTHEMVFNRSEE